MRLLLDLNVLIALAWTNHPHHVLTASWFRRGGARAWASTPATEMGFVRLSCNPLVVGARVTASESSGLLTALRSREDHEFWSDASEAAAVDWTSTTAHRQVPDTHLVAVARAHHGLLATLDPGLAERAGPHAVALITGVDAVIGGTMAAGGGSERDAAGRPSAGL